VKHKKKRSKQKKGGAVEKKHVGTDGAKNKKNQDDQRSRDATQRSKKNREEKVGQRRRPG